MGTLRIAPLVSRKMKGPLAVASLVVLVASCTATREASLPPTAPPGTTSGTTPSAQPAREVRELSPATRDVYRFEFVSNKAGYRVWPISGTAELGAVYRFDVPHCGLTWMMDFDGSFWRLPDTNIPEPKAAWAFLINADRGTIELVATNTAEYVSSTGRPVMLLRLAGPIVTQPCD